MQAKKLQAAALSTQPLYIEDVFSTYLYTGTGSALTITNGIDLATEGGLVWTKRRTDVQNHYLSDTARGTGVTLSSNLITQQLSIASLSVSSFNSNGFSYINGDLTTNAQNYVSWTFRKAPKFFDVVTYTGSGSTQNISHNLGSVPGCIIVKSTTLALGWAVYHVSNGATKVQFLNETGAAQTLSSYWNNTTPTASNFTVGTSTNVNNNGDTYVAYLFAHDAGGFGLSGTDNVISCGSYTGNGSATGPTVTLGYEPQWVLIKRSSASGNDWMLFDNMRGMPDSLPSTGSDAYLEPNTSDAENSGSEFIAPTATGFKLQAIDQRVNASGSTYIYIAIRRGPMKTPTTGTEVFSSVARTATGATYTYTGNAFPVDMVMQRQRAVSNTVDQANIFDRLRGATKYLSTAQTQAEGTKSGITNFDRQDGYTAAFGSWPAMNWTNGSTEVYWNFRRAPGFFDEVCYTGNGSTQNQSHNLAVVPELMIVKARDLNFRSWAVYFGDNSKAMSLNDTTASRSFAGWNYTTPTTSVFSLGADSDVNSSGYTYVAYLFATCAGVSKVGSYTGTGALQTVNCGFTGGARFVLIKRTDSAGDWYVYDSARGISSGNDPYLFLNSTAAEVTGTNYVDTTSVGFQVTAAAPAGLNANGGTFIFLAIA